MRSIRAFLLTRLLGGVALLLAAAGAGVYLFVARSLEAQFDANLDERARTLASLVFQTPDELEFEFSDELMPEYSASELPAYFELNVEGGEPLESSHSLSGGTLVVPHPLDREPRFWTAELPDGRTGRFVARLAEVHHVYPEEGPGRPEAAVLRIVVARGREELVAAERDLLRACALVSLALLATIAAVTWLAVSRGLAPAQKLAGELDAIDVARLPHRLDGAPLPRELEPIGAKTDALLARLAEAFERERRTTADIAHELRTPISEALTVAEVALRNGVDPEHTRSALRTLRDVAQRMGNSVATLLKLARLEMGSEQFIAEEVDVAALAGELVRSLGSQARERELRVELAIPAGEHVAADAEVLRIVLANLLANALHYAPRASRVSCASERDGARWRVIVENDAAALRSEDLALLSQPFWRKDRARSDRHHAGLGLALSRGLAEKTGLELTFELEAGRLRAALSGNARGG